jgi:hypothetical protein
MAFNNMRDLANDIGEVTQATMVGLNKTLKKRLAELQRAQRCWENLLEEVFLLEDVVENENSIDHKIRSTFWFERQGTLGSFLDVLTWLWYVKMRKLVYLIAALFSASLSIWICSGEILQFAETPLNIFHYIGNVAQDFITTQVRQSIIFLNDKFAIRSVALFL